MNNDRELIIKYQSYLHVLDLPQDDQILLQRAREALPSAYAPYSKFQVASAIRLADNQILVGTNQENASYGLCLCAEQNVLATAGSNYHEMAITSLAVTVHHVEKEIDYPISPCGACRQVIREHEARHDQSIRIILQGNGGDILVFNTIEDLLPFAFSPQDLIG